MTPQEIMINEFENEVAELSVRLDPTDQVSILAWDNGLCVGFTADFKPFPCNVLEAEIVGTPEMPEEAWAFTPIVKNGHNEQAKVASRQKIIAREIARYQGLITSLAA